MRPRELLSRIMSPFVRKGEGDHHSGPWWLPITGGWLPAGVGDNVNWWQLGYDPIYGAERSAMVEACVGAYSQTVAMCPGDHWRSTSKGGRERVMVSALSRILRYPNAYQTMSDFLLNATRQLYLDGNAYALALRNNRFEVSELHLMNSAMCWPRVAPTGDIFYNLGGNEIIANQIEGQLVVPDRDVLHIRLHTDRRYPFPLIGETPLISALKDIGLGDAIGDQQLQFYANQARPSAVLSTELQLDKDVVQALRDRWDDQTRGMNQGKTPVLTHGLKVQPWAVGGKDANIADVMKISEQRIALAYRVPLQILGLTGGPSYGSAEAVMQYWIATGLGFALNHIEEAFG